jgi:hypothetical protein
MKNVDVSELATQTEDFLKRYRTSMYEVTSKSTNVFEAFCFVLFVRYYEMVGFDLKAENLLEGMFRFKYNTRGYPWNYSYFVAVSSEPSKRKSAALFEIRHNLKVAGAYTGGQEEEVEPPVFALDIAVIEERSLPHLKRGKKRQGERYWAKNAHLITFGEAKKLTAYPMLLAQFLGIVHEIKPEFLKERRAQVPDTVSQQHHPPPVLFTANHLTWGTKKVLQSFEDRDFSIRVVENVTISPEQVLLSTLRGDSEQDLSESEIPF